MFQYTVNIPFKIKSKEDQLDVRYGFRTIEGNFLLDTNFSHFLK